MNEPFDNHDLMDLYGDDVMLEWFQAAREADPNAKLFINDYGILSGGGLGGRHRDHYDKIISFLLEKGAELDAIGLQGHVGMGVTAPQDLRQILDRFGRFNKPIWITEYDMRVDDEKMQADYTRDFLISIFSHESVQGFLMWGFWDGAHWGSNAPLFTRDWKLKPSGQVYRDLVWGQWRTWEKQTTGEAGVVTIPAFLGDYDIMVKYNNRQQDKKINLAKGGTTAEIRF